jgi:hypothetical protein
MTMSADDIERQAALIVVNARNLPAKERPAFVDAACIDLRTAGMIEGTVRAIKERATERLAAEKADTSRPEALH